MSSQQVNRRIRLLLLGLLLVFGALLGRALWVQTVRAGSLSAMAQSQQHETLTTPAGRGTPRSSAGWQASLLAPGAAGLPASIAGLPEVGL